MVRQAVRWLQAHRKAVFWASGGVLGAVLLLRGKERSRFVRTNTPTPQVKEVLEREARAQGVPIPWVMAWVDVESGFKDALAGDRWWPFTPKFDRYVLQNPIYAQNPFRHERALWVSYGLFQLLSPHWLHRVDPNASPEILANLETNARLGVGMLADLRACTGGDFVWARLIAKGCASCNSRTSRCSFTETQTAIARAEAIARAYSVT